MYTNSLVRSFFKRLYIKKYFRCNAVYSNLTKGFRLPTKSSICFYLGNSEFIHLGDFSFFLPSIYALSKKYNLYVYLDSNHQKILEFFFQDKIEIHPIKKPSDLSQFNLIITQPYLINEVDSYKFLAIGLPSSLINVPYPQYILDKIHFFLNFKSFSSSYSYYLKRISNNIHSDSSKIFLKKYNLNKSDKYIILSPFMGSGKFRDPFKILQKKIFSLLINLNNHNKYKVILVGSITDKINFKIPFQYHDFRGINIYDLMTLINNKQICFGIGFDNYWMHFFNIIEKQYFTIHRRHFTITAIKNHRHSINLSFKK